MNNLPLSAQLVIRETKTKEKNTLNSKDNLSEQAEVYHKPISKIIISDEED